MKKMITRKVVLTLVSTLVLMSALAGWALYPREWNTKIHNEDDWDHYLEGSHITYVHPEIVNASHLGILALCIAFTVVVVLGIRAGKSNAVVAVICGVIMVPALGFALLVSLVHLMAPTPILDEYHTNGKSYHLAYQGFLQADSVYMLSKPERGLLYSRYPLWGHSVGPYETRNWLPVVRPASANSKQCLFPIAGEMLIGVFENRAFMLIDMKQDRIIEDAVFDLDPFILLDANDELTENDLDELKVWAMKLAKNKSYAEELYDGKYHLDRMINAGLKHPNEKVRDWVESLSLQFSVQATQPSDDDSSESVD